MSNQRERFLETTGNRKLIWAFSLFFFYMSQESFFFFFLRKVNFYKKISWNKDNKRFLHFMMTIPRGRAWCRVTGLFVKRLTNGVRSRRWKYVSCLKPFSIWETVATSYSVTIFLRTEMFSWLFHWAFAYQNLRISAQMSQDLHHLTDVSWMYRPSGRGCDFFFMLPTSNFSELYAHLLICQLSFLNR